MSNEAQNFEGLWVTADRQVRIQLMGDDRFDEARGTREHVYTGAYRIEGDAIHFQDQYGNQVSGEFRDGVLYAGGFELHKE